MGQRNATYLLTATKTKGIVTNHSILPIYNQWNFIKIQAPKMVRGIKAVLKHSFQYVGFSFVPFDMIYYAAAGTFTYKSEGKKIANWVGGRIETNLYTNGEYRNAFDEDNNNGWNIVKFIIDTETEKVDIEIFCVVGSEDEDDTNSESLTNYFNNKHKVSKKDLKYLAQFKWNLELENEARHELLKLIPKMV